MDFNDLKSEVFATFLGKVYYILIINYLNTSWDIRKLGVGRGCVETKNHKTHKSFCVTKYLNSEKDTQMVYRLLSPRVITWLMWKNKYSMQVNWFLLFKFVPLLYTIVLH